MKRTVERLKKIERPKIVQDLQHALSLGDFSENAEYHDAKHRLSKIDGRIFSLGERIKNAIIIPKGGEGDGIISLGSTVEVEVNGETKTYTILGPQEADPSRGHISHLSPLGSQLIGRKAGETVEITMPNGDVRAMAIISVE